MALGLLWPLQILSRPPVTAGSSWACRKNPVPTKAWLRGAAAGACVLGQGVLRPGTALRRPHLASCGHPCHRACVQGPEALPPTPAATVPALQGQNTAKPHKYFILCCKIKHSTCAQGITKNKGLCSYPWEEVEDHGGKWEEVEGHGRKWEEHGNCGRKWEEVEARGRKWEEVGGHGSMWRTWEGHDWMWEYTGEKQQHPVGSQESP